MSVWFSLKEGLSGFKRTRLASFITISSVALALFLVGLFILFSTNINHWIGQKRAKMELEVFFESGLENTKARALSKQVEKTKGVESVQFISKEEAAKRFEKEFGRSIYEVLDSNPLPPSCTVSLKADYQTASAIRKLEQDIGKLDGITEVVYAKELIMLIDHYISWIFFILGLFGLILLLIAVILLYNTIRLTILARRDIIEIMGLVGATAAFIKRPFIIEGFLQGLVGALLAGGLLYISTYIIQRFLFSTLTIQTELYVVLAVVGALIGMLSSQLSLSRYLDRI